MIFPLILAHYFILTLLIPTLAVVLIYKCAKNDKHIFTIFDRLSSFIVKDINMPWTICVLFHQI